LNCNDVTILYEVQIFDPNSAPSNPFLAHGSLLNSVCPDDGFDQMVQMQICNDPVEVTTSFPVGSTFSWQKYDENLACSRTTQSCAYNTSCYVELSTATSFNVDDAGDYRLAVISADGGCEFVYYMQAIPIDITPVLNVTGGGCEDELTYVVTGVDLDDSLAVNYDAVFEVTNNGNTTTELPNVGDNTLVIPRVAGETYVVKALVSTTDIVGSCVFETTQESDTFINFQASYTIQQQATCTFDSDVSDTFDPTKAIVSVTASLGYPTYVFELVDTASGNILQSSGAQNDNTYSFENIDPTLTYEVNAYGSGVSVAGNCSATIPVTGLGVPITFEATPSVTKDLDCAPASIEVTVNITDLGTTTNPNPDFRITIAEIPGNIYMQDQTILVDDISRYNPMAATVTADPIAYTDLSTTTDLTIVISTPDGCALERQVTINPYTAPSFNMTRVDNVTCNGLSDGVLQVEAFSASGDPLIGETYAIVAGPEARAPQTTNIFDSLAAGTYTIELATTDGCTLQLIQQVVEPDALTAPVISSGSYTCDNTGTILSLDTLVSGGTLPYEYQLFRDASLYRSFTSIADLTAEELQEGDYYLEVDDANMCGPVVSNTITIEALPEITVTQLSQGDFTCTSPTDTPTKEVVLSATVDTSDTILGYRIIATTDTSGTLTTNITYTLIADPTNMAFSFPEGTHSIEFVTTNTNCPEIYNVTIAPYVELEVDAPSLTGVSCYGVSDAIISTTVASFDLIAGYDYELTFEGNVVANATGQTSGIINITGLEASNNPNDYELTVTDLRTDNCNAPIVSTHTITSPSQPIIDNITSIYDCENDEYIITVTASQGTGMGYTFSVDTTPATTTTASTFTIPSPSAATTYTVSVADSDNCIGATTPLLLDVAPTFTATLSTASQLCYNDALPSQVFVDVDGTAPITYRLQGTTNLETATVTSNRFEIVNAQVLPGTYTYEIFDANYSDCPETVTYTINDRLTATNQMTTLLDCLPSGAIPTTGAMLSFDVSGGSGVYTYSFIPNTITVPNTGTNASPIFEFDNSFDGQNIIVNVTDGQNCTIQGGMIDVLYPTGPNVAVNVTDMACNGETAIVSLDPGVVGTVDDSNYEYSFDGGTTYTSVSSTNSSMGILNYVVRDISTNCTTTGNVTITEPDVITAVIDNLTNITCVGGIELDGAVEITAQGGTLTTANPNYTYSLFSNADNFVLPVQILTSATTVNFTNLAEGSYQVRITDANGCINPSPIAFEIRPVVEVLVVTEDAQADCTDRVTVYFSIDGGSVNANDFEIALSSHSTPIDPTLTGDRIHRIDDADFPTTLFDASAFSATSITDNKVFAITGIDFNISDFFIVEDTSTGCRTSVDYNAPDSPDVTLTADPVNAGACSNNSGSVNLSFSTVQNSTLLIDIIDVTTGNTVLGTPLAPFTMMAGVAQTQHISGLPVGNLRVIAEQTAGLNCSATSEFDISVSSPITVPVELDQSSRNCRDFAQVSVSTTGGSNSFAYALTEITDFTVPSAVNFTLSDVIVFDDTNTFYDNYIDASGNVAANIWVIDTNTGCTEGPLQIGINAFPSPTIDFDTFSAQECDASGPYTFNYEITNYDPAQTYSIEIDGGAPQTLANSATGTFEVATIGDHSVVMYGSTFDFCEVTQTFNVPEQFVAQATLALPNCDAQITSLEVVTTGGYTTSGNRSIDYQVYNGASLVASITGSTNTTETFTFNGVDFGGIVLNAGTDYTIQVTDYYDAVGVPSRSCVATDNKRQDSVVLPTFETPITNQICVGGTNGTALINIVTGYTDSVTYELYEVPNTITIPAVVDATFLAGIPQMTPDATVPNFYQNLQGQSSVSYLPVVRATAQNCLVVGTAFSIPEYDVLDINGFTFTPITGTCVPLVQSSLRIDVDPTLALGTAPYYYKIDNGAVTTFTEIIGTSVEVFLNIGTYTITVTDATFCSELDSAATVILAPEEPILNITSDDAFSCNLPQEQVTLTVTNATATEQFRIVNTTFTDVDGNQTTVNTIGDSGVNPLPIGDFDEIFTLGDSGVYIFEVENIATGCSTTLSHTIEEIRPMRIAASDVEVNCNADLAQVNFNIRGYNGDLNYAIENSAAVLVANGTVEDYGTTPVITSQTGNTVTVNTTTGAFTIDGVSAEVYTLTITTPDAITSTDSTNPFCTVSTFFEVIEPTALNLSILDTQELTCSNGSAVVRVEATGGNLDYTYAYAVSGGSTLGTNTTGVFDTGLINTDTSGATTVTYEFTVTDDKGCSSSVTYDVVYPQTPTLTSVNVAPITCNGDATTIDVTATGGTGTLEYALYRYDTLTNTVGDEVIPWQVSSTFNNVYANLVNESYEVQVRDSYGCIVNQLVPVVQNDMVVLSLDNFDDYTCLQPEDRITLTATGGTSNYTYEHYDASYNETTIPNLLASNTTGIFNVVGENYFRVIDTNGCWDTITVNASEGLQDLTFELDFDVDNILCFGEPGGFVGIVQTSLSGGSGDYTAAIYLASDTGFTTPLDATTTPAVTQLNDFAFSDLPANEYVYRLVSEATPSEVRCEHSIAFEVRQHPELTIELAEAIEIGCAGENDGIIRLKLTEGLGVGDFVFAVQHTTDTLPIFADQENIQDIDTVEFTGLQPGDYTYTIFDNGTGCTGPSGNLTIADKDPLLVSLDTVNSVSVVCANDTAGENIYNISGGTAPYYAVLLDDPDASEPEAEDIVGDVTYLIAGSDVAGVEVTGVTYTTGATLTANTPYRLYIYDSGNRQVGDNFVVCDFAPIEFIFETEDLADYTIEPTPNCTTSQYTVSVVPTDEDINARMLLFERNIDGSNGASVGFPDADNPLVYRDVDFGVYNVYLESLDTGCITDLSDRQSLILDPILPVEFVTEDVNGIAVQPFVATNNINEYQLQVIGGVNPTAINPYSFEGTYVSANGTSSGTISIDDEGVFTLLEDGFYSFRVIDNYATAGTACDDTVTNIGLDYLDVDVPNVFNPNSSDPLMSSWYPENITNIFEGEVTPVDGDVPLPTIVTTEDATLQAGITVEGTTTDGITAGGSIDSFDDEVVINPTVPIATLPNGTTYYITTGGITSAGTTSEATTIEVSVVSGQVTVTFYEDAVVVGGVADANGVITGGALVSGFPNVISGDRTATTTQYNITTGGTTTGGTTTGGISLGGTAVYNTSDPSIVTGDFPNMITTDGTIEGAETTGGITLNGTTVTIELTDTGDLSIDYFTNTSVQGGTTTSGVTTGGVTTGGVLISGNTSTESIEFVSFENVEVFVFDRYGRLLKKMTGIRDKYSGDTGWDGTYEGQGMPSGDYWYLIKLNDKEEREFTGHFTLYRD